MVAIPIIDIGPLVSSSPDAGAVASTIGRACRETGFFYVVRHGIPPETVETVFAMSRSFFAQPLAAKEKAGWDGPSGNRGWIRLGSELLDPGKPHDLKEAFNIGLELPSDDPEVVAGRPFRGPIFPASAPRRSPISTPAGGSVARCTVPSRSISALRPISSRASSPGRSRPCACSTTRPRRRRC
jgi:isopenicillin N synthase-like dioxygenase